MLPCPPPRLPPQTPHTRTPPTATPSGEPHASAPTHPHNAPSHAADPPPRRRAQSLAPKFDYWRSLVAGHPEIDTHQIVSVSEASQQAGGFGGGGGGPQMLHPSQMDPSQLQRMGLGNLAGGPGPGLG